MQLDVMSIECLSRKKELLSSEAISVVFTVTVDLAITIVDKRLSIQDIEVKYEDTTV